jgi:hypothetical protein
MKKLSFLFGGIVVLVILMIGATMAFLPQNSTASQTSTTSESSTTTKGGSLLNSSVYTGSQNGLILGLSLNASTISQGQTISLTIGERNSLQVQNNVSAERNWPLAGLSIGPCGSLNYPFGFEILSGYYADSSPGLSSAKSLQLYAPGAYPCPAVFEVSSYLFNASSDLASIGSCGTGPCTNEEMSSTTTIRGYWNGDSFELPSPGMYTVVVGDEWGATLLGYFVVTSAGSGSSVILPTNTSLEVSSSFDCVAGHFSLGFSVPEQSTLAGGFSAEAPGVTMYVATAQQAATTFQGHPVNWVYTTGLENSSRFSVSISPGSYEVWIEGADLNCGSQIVTPLEQLTQVNITEGFALTNQSAGGLIIRSELNSSRIASGATVGITVSDYNPSSMELNLSKESVWAVDGLSTGGCPSLYFPFGIAVYQGRYTSANLSQAVPLQIFPATPCPMLVRYITGYLFQPTSDNATVLPGSGAVPMAMGVSVSGTYNATGNHYGQLTTFTPGTYTVVAGDEWGNLAFAYFIVT